MRRLRFFRSPRSLRQNFSSRTVVYIALASCENLACVLRLVPGPCNPLAFCEPCVCCGLPYGTRGYRTGIAWVSHGHRRVRTLHVRRTCGFAQDAGVPHGYLAMNAGVRAWPVRAEQDELTILTYRYIYGTVTGSSSVTSPASSRAHPLRERRKLIDGQRSSKTSSPSAFAPGSPAPAHSHPPGPAAG